MPSTLEPPLEAPVPAPAFQGVPAPSLFEATPDTVRRALSYASASLGRGPIRVEAIACLSADRSLAREGQFGTWTRDIWTVVRSATEFTNILVWCRLNVLKTVMKRRIGNGAPTVINSPQPVLFGMRARRYLCLRANLQLEQSDGTYSVSDVTVTGLVNDDGSFSEIEA